MVAAIVKIKFGFDSHDESSGVFLCVLGSLSRWNWKALGTRFSVSAFKTSASLGLSTYDTDDWSRFRASDAYADVYVVTIVSLVPPFGMCLSFSHLEQTYVAHRTYSTDHKPCFAVRRL